MYVFHYVVREGAGDHLHLFCMISLIPDLLGNASACLCQGVAAEGKRGEMNNQKYEKQVISMKRRKMNAKIMHKRVASDFQSAVSSALSSSVSNAMP